jgi:hypothetical protein
MVPCVEQPQMGKLFFVALPSKDKESVASYGFSYCLFQSG